MSLKADGIKFQLAKLGGRGEYLKLQDWKLRKELCFKNAYKEREVSWFVKNEIFSQVNNFNINGEEQKVRS